MKIYQNRDKELTVAGKVCHYVVTMEAGLNVYVKGHAGQCFVLIITSPKPYILALFISSEHLSQFASNFQPAISTVFVFFILLFCGVFYIFFYTFFLSCHQINSRNARKGTGSYLATRPLRRSSRQAVRSSSSPSSSMMTVEWRTI